MIRVLIADGSDVVRQGIRQVLEAESAIAVCGEAQDGEELVAKAQALHPAVVVVDVELPKLNGIEATGRIREALPETEVVVLTTHGAEPIVREALQAGAIGYALKSDPARLLLDAVLSAGEHKRLFSPAVNQLLLSGFLQQTRTRPSELGLFTEREREILQLIAEGNSSKQIAAGLTLSIKTIEGHRASLMRKLKTSSLVQLVHYAIRHSIGFA